VNIAYEVLSIVCALTGCAESTPYPQHVDASTNTPAEAGPEPPDSRVGADAKEGVDATTDQNTDGGPIADGKTNTSCADEGPSSSACRYVYSDGTATITRIEDAPAGSNRCPQDPVSVRFDFEPDDPASRRCAKDEQFPVEARWSFTLADGKAPPRSCLEQASIVVGSRLRVRRRDIVSGACTPVLFVFDHALVASCLAKCFR
jgi:hypothetical protein